MGAGKSLARQGRKQANVSVRMACISNFQVYFLRRRALQENRLDDISRVSMLLKSRTSLTCFRACFLPGRAKHPVIAGCKVQMWKIIIYVFRPSL